MMTPPPNAEELSPERISYLNRQEFLFEQMKATLVAEYLGEFIAFEDGIVLDHDANEMTLLSRVYRAHGYRDLLIKQVFIHEPHRSNTRTNLIEANETVNCLPV
jgi:hypothetical protein